MDDEAIELINPNEQRHYSVNRLIRTRQKHALEEHSDEVLAAQIGHLAYAFGLPHDLPMPPASLPGFWDKKVDPLAMEIIRDGVRYLVAIANGEKRTLWHIHDDLVRELRQAYQRGREDQANEFYDKRVAAAEENDRRKWAANKHSKVYFIRAAGGPIKIGKANRPESRLKELQTGHHAKLEIAATCPGGLDVEQAYHKRFAEFREHGEWFSPHPEILAEIERLSR